jgi:hypothetical protein
MGGKTTGKTISLESGWVMILLTMILLVREGQPGRKLG